MSKTARAVHTTPVKRSCKHRPKTVPPEPHPLVRDINAHLEKKVYHTAKAQRVPNVHLHRQPDHLGRRVEAPDWVGWLAHPGVLSAPLPRRQF